MKTIDFLKKYGIKINSGVILLLTTILFFGLAKLIFIFMYIFNIIIIESLKEASNEVLMIACFGLIYLFIQIFKFSYYVWSDRVEMFFETGENDE